MDFQLYARVLWRFKLLVVARAPARDRAGDAVVVRVSADGAHVPPDGAVVEHDRVGVTQKGFPWGRLLAPGPSLDAAQAQDLGIPLADPNRLNKLAVLYAELATSDPVRRADAPATGPIRGKIIATPVVVRRRPVSRCR